MNKAKKLLAILLSCVTCLSVAACGKDDESSSHVDQIEVPDAESIGAIPEGEAGELEWLSYFDLNPVGKAESSAELTLFKQKGGSIKYTRTSSMNKFQKLAARVIADDPPDLFWYEQGMTFPANCMQNMFQPVDSIVDFDSGLWANVKESADQFVLNGQHYVAPISFNMTSIITYDADRIEELGVDDPYELYLDGEWDWDAMKEIMDAWVSSGSDGDETPRTGVNGWFHTFIFRTTGETIIKLNEETGEYENNIYNAELERAAAWLYDISKAGLVNTQWFGDCGEAFQANVLFYSMGPWASSGAEHTPDDTENWKNVLVPRDPNADKYYYGLDTNAYMWVAGSEKSAAVKCWLECAKLVNTDQSYVELAKQKFFVNNPYWTDEMYELAYNPQANDVITVLNDPGYGISTILSDNDAATNDTLEAVIPYLYSSVSKTDENGTQMTWAQLRDGYNNTINTELKTFNDKLKAFTGK